MAWQVVISSLLLVPVTLALTWVGDAGGLYFSGALLLGLASIVYGTRLAVSRSRPLARSTLMASVVYLPLIFALMMLCKPNV